MRKHSMLVAAMAAVLTSACAKRGPEPAGIAPGTPHVGWVIMSGDGDNPDREFVCQSNPLNDCVVPASRPDAQVFSHVHFYYRGAGGETKYSGSINVGFFQGSRESHELQANITVQGTSIANQSVIGIVSSTAGRYPIVFALVATSTATGTSQPIRVEVPVVVQ
jgi:hypothetical protein